LAGLELDCEWMGKEIVLCALFVDFQGIVKNELKIGRRGTSRVSVRHENRREE
jgi:hypothetical protein